MRRDHFLRLVHRAVQSIPAEFHQYLENVEFLIQGEPSSATLERLGLGPDDTLFGLYEGVPVTERSIEDGGVVTDTITIFQEPLEEQTDDEAELEEEVRRTIIHEVAHHFGLDEEDVARHGFE